ncbi:MAG: hypothetical protein KC417_02695, partial [Myxococcales bacterium]|nr:hypothetical protein [Myxococcales bacterium]
MDSLAGERLTALILRKKHRWLKWVLGVLAVVIGLPTLIVLFTVYTPWGQRRMAALAIEALHDELGLNATLERVNIEMFPPKIEAQGILLDVPKYGRFAEANALVIRPSLFAFARGAVDFEEVRLEDPTLNLVVRDGRVVNLPKPRRTGGPSEVPKEIPVKHVVVRGAKLTVDAAPHGTGVLEGVTFTLDTHKGMLVDVDLSAAAGRIEHTKGVESVYGIELKGRAGPDGVDVERFRLASEFVKVDLRDGHVPIPFGSGYQGKAYVRVDLAHANQLPVDVELPHVDGVVEVEGELTGTPEGPVADGVLRIDGVHVEQWGFGTLTLAIHADHEAIEIKNGVGEIVDGGGTVGIKGRLGLGPSLPLTISLDIQNLQFAKLMDQLGVSPNAIVQWTVTGPAKLSGTLNPLILDGPLHIQTKDFLVTNGAWHDANSFRIVGVDSASLRSHVSVRSDALRFLDIDATLPKSKIKGDVLLGFDNALRVTAVVDGLDLADTTPLLDFPIGGVGSARVDVGGTMLAPTLKGHLTAKDFVFNTFPVGNIDTDMLLENHTETVRFPRISVEKNTSRFVVNDLVLDFRDDRFRAGGAADFAALELTDFLHIFHYDADPRFAGMTAHMQGKLAVDYTRGFPGDAPTGTMVAKVDMDADRAAIAGVAFDGGAIDGTWRWTDYARGYEGGTLDVRHASLRKGRGTLSARGSMGLGGALRMTASADRLALTELEPVRQRTTALGGLLGFVANVGGTVAEPRIGADLTLSSLSYGQSLLGDGRFYVRMTDRADPWLADPTRGA